MLLREYRELAKYKHSHIYADTSFEDAIYELIDVRLLGIDSNNSLFKVNKVIGNVVNYIYATDKTIVINDIAYRGQLDIVFKSHPDLGFANVVYWTGEAPEGRLDVWVDIPDEYEQLEAYRHLAGVGFAPVEGILGREEPNINQAPRPQEMNIEPVEVAADNQGVEAAGPQPEVDFFANVIWNEPEPPVARPVFRVPPDIDYVSYPKLKKSRTRAAEKEPEFYTYKGNKYSKALSYDQKLYIDMFGHNKFIKTYRSFVYKEHVVEEPINEKEEAIINFYELASELAKEEINIINTTAYDPEKDSEQYNKLLKKYIKTISKFKRTANV